MLSPVSYGMVIIITSRVEMLVLPWQVLVHC